MQTPEIIRAAALTLAALAGICCMYQSVYLVVSIIVRLREGRGGLPAVVPKQLPRFGVLIAARNEQAVLPYLLQSIREQDYPRELVRVFVVADNCTDDTALAAERAGATVWRRFDRERIGKGYALAYLLEHMEKSGQTEGIDAFLVFDADNLLCPDYLRQISRMYTQGFAAFHGYRNTKNFGDSWISSGYGVWFLHDSIHLNTARMALGTTCAVSGTGFGFTKELLEQCGGWRFFTLTEDVEFDTWCATHGVRIGFCREAMLYDEQPVTLRQSWTQRIRWVQGGIHARPFARFCGHHCVLQGRTTLSARLSGFTRLPLLQLHCNCRSAGLLFLLRQKKQAKRVAWRRAILRAPARDFLAASRPERPVGRKFATIPIAFGADKCTTRIFGQTASISVLLISGILDGLGSCTAPCRGRCGHRPLQTFTKNKQGG